MDFNTPDQDFYDELVNTLPFHQLQCPCCHHSGCLTVHGYYTRHVKASESLNELRICRVICGFCEKTHALLPVSLVPYSQISLSDQHQIITNYDEKIKQDTFLEEHPLIDENNIKAVIRSYVRHWLQRLTTDKVELCPLPELIRTCFMNHLRHFMQIKCTPNILFQIPT